MKNVAIVLIIIIFLELAYGFMPSILAKAGISESVYIPSSSATSAGSTIDPTLGLPISEKSFSDYNEDTIDKSSFYLRIDKIDLFKRIVQNVDPRDKTAYVDSWNYGVSHGRFTSTPDKIGITYLFSHASGNKDDALNQNAWFSNMDQLQIGDEVIIYYDFKKYTYSILDIFAVDPTATGFYTGASPVAKVRMQYCGPPTGSLGKRTLVDAILTDTVDI